MKQSIFAITAVLTICASAAAQPVIFGPLSGSLGPGTFIVIGNISVDSGDSLKIQPGTTLKFNNNVQFEVNWYLYAVGTETDSIKFMKNEGATAWGGIDFNGTADDNSELVYCFITGSNSCGISCNSSNPLISNSTISENTSTNGSGIYCASSNPTIVNCIISENIASDCGSGIFCGNSSPSINNCSISGNTASEYGGGIYCYNSSPAILNTVVEGNFGNYGLYLYSSANTNITYNDFYNNQGGNFSNPPQGVGQIVTVNANGDSCDIYHNIFFNPLFYSTTGDSAFYLTANSPCIDAGDPASPLDPDGTVADIGAYYFYQLIIEPEVLDFGVLDVGETDSLSVLISNTGIEEIIIDTVYNSLSVFTFDSSAIGAVIPPGDSLEITVTFTPDSSMDYIDTLYVAIE
ncbi:right-handed parallel beta-helix repeat-containing protein, partial [bacterium]|nr:right-handed parallel beta-helix repeat-containing protein [bacterium]